MASERVFKNTEVNNVRVYADKAWLFSNGMLITVLEVLNNLKIACKSAKNKHRGQNDVGWKSYRD